MGNIFAKLFKNEQTKNCRILIQGLDSAGKTSLVFKLKVGEVISTMPTLGFNVEEV